MDIYRFKAKPDGDGYFTIAAASALQTEQMTAVTINNHKIVLAGWAGEFFAFSAVCPHASGDLSQGWMGRYKVTCPEHAYCWDIRSGRILWPEDEYYRLKKYPVRIEDGLVKVCLD